MGTESSDYADRLVSLESTWWKRLLPVQAPYRWNLRRQHLGRTLDIGCGIGRNLAFLPAGSVGVDHNETSVRIARERGLEACTVAEFEAGWHSRAKSFDALLLAHVVEHMPPEAAREVLGGYLGHLRPGGKVFLVCPQERGYASDQTHQAWTTGADLVRLCRDVGLQVDRWHSFPLPRAAGRWFRYNEFTVLARRPDRLTPSG